VLDCSRHIVPVENVCDVGAEVWPLYATLMKSQAAKRLGRDVDSVDGTAE
jgi:hypothetical protein